MSMGNKDIRKHRTERHLPWPLIDTPLDPLAGLERVHRTLNILWMALVAAAVATVIVTFNDAIQSNARGATMWAMGCTSIANEMGTGGKHISLWECIR